MLLLNRHFISIAINIIYIVILKIKIHLYYKSIAGNKLVIKFIILSNKLVIKFIILSNKLVIKFIISIFILSKSFFFI